MNLDDKKSQTKLTNLGEKVTNLWKKYDKSSQISEKMPQASEKKSGKKLQIRVKKTQT